MLPLPTNGSIDEQINDVVDKLCDPDAFVRVAHRSNHDFNMPSTEAMREIMELLRAILFPGYFGYNDVKPETMRYYLGANLDRVIKQLAEQVRRGFCFDCFRDAGDQCADCDSRARYISHEFLASLPGIRASLATDVQAAFEGDPAAKTPGEAIFCYPSIRALTNHRVAHALYDLEVPLIPRILSEMAHSETGIDIHPGATIGDYFFMDHGTGIVIGETATIGSRVRLYQGVTLGAKSFPLDEHGNPIKGIPRHPNVEDDVIIYAGATILGRITIGARAIIGGNLWVTKDVPADGRILQVRFQESSYEDGLGI